MPCAPTALKDGFAEAASSERWSHFFCAQRVCLHNSDRRLRGSFFRRGRQEACWHQRPNIVPCGVDEPLN